jgi:hypothetical protein
MAVYTVTPFWTLFNADSGLASAGIRDRSMPILTWCDGLRTINAIPHGSHHKSDRGAGETSDGDELTVSVVSNAFARRRPPGRHIRLSHTRFPLRCEAQRQITQSVPWAEKVDQALASTGSG